MRPGITLVALHALLVGMLACNLQGSTGNAQPDLAGTITAQAAQIATALAASLVPTLTPTITLTPTPTVPTVQVTSGTNCRTGPSKIYDYVLSFDVGMTAEIIGKDTPANYWIIKMPNGVTCWLWGQNAVVSGNPDRIPEKPAPPTPTPAGAPAAPSNLYASKTCPPLFDYSGIPPLVYVHWLHVGDNESGFRVYRGGYLLATLGANETSYENSYTDYDASLGAETYGVEAFNDMGASTREQVETEDCFGTPPPS